MTTKKYLSQLFNIDSRIKNKNAEAEMWREMATSIGVNSSDSDRVQKTSSKEKMADAVARAIDSEEEARKLATKLVDLKKRIISQIDAIENNLYYNILVEYYLQNMSLSEISDQENYSYQQIKRKYKDSLAEFERLHGYTYLKPKDDTE